MVFSKKAIYWMVFGPPGYIYIFVHIDIQSIPSIRIHSENSQGTGEGPGVYRRHQGTVDQNPKLVGLYTVYL